MDLDASSVVAVAGEAITDFVPTGEDAVFRASPGGSPANVAVGLARLGVPTRMLARLSTDVLGRRLAAHLAANGVDLSAAVSTGEPSSLAIVVVQQDGSARYDFRVDGTADWQWQEAELAHALDGVRALHVGSLSLTTPPGGALLRGLAERARATATVTFDPNARPLLMGGPTEVLGVVRQMLRVADVVKASEEDVGWLLPGRSPADVAAEWATHGPALVIVTCGADGAVAAGAAAGLVERGGVAVDVVDTVGAGDSFMSAVVAGLYSRDLLGADRREALRGLRAPEIDGLLAEAVSAAALTCSRPGADPPDASELDAFLRT